MAIEDSVTVVTGSATGLGAAIARQIAAKGGHVVVNYTKSDAEAKETVAACEALGVETLLVQADVAEDGDCRRMARAAVDKWGRIDALVNNAGITAFADHDDLDALEADDFHRLYGVNVVGAFQMIRACAPHLKAAGTASVVNISSIAAVTGIGSSVAYAASKGALNTMTLSLARALGPEIRVNAICPGFIGSRWFKDRLGAEGYAKLVENVKGLTPLKAASSPDDIAETAVWLVEGGRHVTGETIIVDAGMHLNYAPLVAR